jgi:hypothetical protein
MILLKILICTFCYSGFEYLSLTFLFNTIMVLLNWMIDGHLDLTYLTFIIYFPRNGERNGFLFRSLFNNIANLTRTRFLDRVRGS